MSHLQLVIQKLCVRLTSVLPHESGEGARTLLVSSAHRGEGKTFVSSAVAVHLSKLGEGRVLLVDANFERPALHKRYKLSNAAGFYQSLVDDRFEPSEWLKEGETLAVLPAGQGCDSSVLFNQHRVKKFLDRARSAFDYIVFDGASIGGSGGNGLAHLVDGVVLVVDSRSTRRQVVKDAINTIEVPKERFLGVVLNKRKYEIPAFLYRWI